MDTRWTLCSEHATYGDWPLTRPEMTTNHFSAWGKDESYRRASSENGETYKNILYHRQNVRKCNAMTCIGVRALRLSERQHGITSFSFPLSPLALAQNKALWLAERFTDHGSNLLPIRVFVDKQTLYNYHGNYCSKTYCLNNEIYAKKENLNCMQHLY